MLEGGPVLGGWSAGRQGVRPRVSFEGGMRLTKQAVPLWLAALTQASNQRPDPGTAAAALERDAS